MRQRMDEEAPRTYEVIRDRIRTSGRWECVHFIDSSECQRLGALSDDGFHVAFAQAAPRLTSAELIPVIADKFNFPEHYGRNWDAVNEYLSDLEWLDATGYVLVVEGVRKMSRPIATLIGVWLSAAQEWGTKEGCERWHRAETRPFHLVIGVDWSR